jgi:hypothetical protein
VGRCLSLWAGVSDTGTDEALPEAQSVREVLPACRSRSARPTGIFLPLIGPALVLER